MDNSLNLKFGLKFEDLYDPEGLKRLDDNFSNFFAAVDQDLYQKFVLLRSKKNIFSKKEQDDILLEAAKVVEDFIAELFVINKENEQLRKSHKDFDVVAKIRRDYIQRKIAKKFDRCEEGVDGVLLLQKILQDNTNQDIAQIELLLARKIDNLDELSEQEVKNIEDYCRWALFCELGVKFHKNGALFRLPKKIDYQNLVDFDKEKKDPVNRDGFDLLDQGFDLNQALSEANYCIFCHKQGKDSCSTGLTDKKSQEFVDNPLGVKLEGCPLEQKISEMNLLKSQGYSIASMTVAAIDNPLMAATGHRICNDCMKSCIFQKQDPVNIPQIESENLKGVLSLPYGFEIYSLISRWNPLNFEQKVIEKLNGQRILVAGLGPAGFALSYYLLNKGYDVVAIDGLKIEPLTAEICGIDMDGNRQKFRPIKDINDIKEPLSQRTIQGFGGVCEYGITSRWDKNFLTIIRLLLERRRNFRMFGGVRFGSSITDEVAFNDYNFDHIALCIGAGRPNIINIKNNFCKGVKSSSDFLMNLQLSGAFKEDLFVNLQIRAPIVVIGAGLTAIDTACEAQEYYLSQIKKFRNKIDILEDFYGRDKLWSFFNEEESLIAAEFLEHEEVLRQNGKQALFDKIGNAKIIYRKKLQDSPAYKQNHEELIYAAKQGVVFMENCNPVEVISDKFGSAEYLLCDNGEKFNSRTVLIAAGTAPNISVVDEDKLNLNIDEKYFAQVDLQRNSLQKTSYVKHGNYSFFTKIDDDNKSVSFFGDLHPNFEGNVVKAITSAKLGHKQIAGFLNKNKKQSIFNIFDKKAGDFCDINRDFVAKINKVRLLSDSLNEVEVRAPLSAKMAKIGNIFRLQNYYNLSEKRKGQTMMIEGIALTATKINQSKGLISGTLLDYGGSTSLVKYLKDDQPCVFMGPGGNETKIVKDKTVLLVGSGRGNAVLTRMAEKFKKDNCKVILCLSFKDQALITDVEQMKRNSDVLILSILNSSNMVSDRNGDLFSAKPMLEVIAKYFTDNDQQLDHILVIGGDKMMTQFSKLRNSGKVRQLTQCQDVIVSLNAPMQCMMKGVCSQCLQKRTDDRGNVEYYYSCANQDQKIDEVDFKHLSNRCEQNKLQEKVTKYWIGYLKSK